MNWDQTTVDVQDNYDRVYLASQCGKNVKGAFDEGVLTILAVRLPAAPNAAQAGHLTQTGDSDTLLLRKVEASIGDLSQMVYVLKRYLEPMLKKVERTSSSAHIHQTETSENLCPGTPRLAAVSPTGKRAALSIGSLPSALRKKDLSPGPLSCEERGSRTKRCVKHEKGRQECLPHLHTRILNGSTSLYAGVALIDWRIKQLNVTIACINQAYHLRKRADP